MKCIVKGLSVLALVTILVVGLAMCGQCSESKRYTIGVSIPTLANPFWQRYVDFQKQVAEALGIDLVIIDAENREEKQLNDVESLIASRVDGLIVTPQTAPVGPAILKRAEEAGVPVVVTDRWPGIDPNQYQGKQYVAFVGPDDVQAGYSIAEALYNAGIRNIVAIHGVQGASVTEGRKAGLHKFLDEHQDMKLLQEQHIGELREQGQQVMQAYLVAFPSPQIEGVWCYNDALAMGALQAVKDANRLKEIRIAGMDLNDDAVQAIKNGEYLFSCGGHWLQGGFGLLIIFDYLNGKQPTEKIVKLKLLGVTKDNVSKFLEQYIENPPKYDFKQMSQVFNPDAKTHFEITLK